MTHYSSIKEWLLRWLEPYREVRASELLAWRIFAQKHNAADKRPRCWYVGMEDDKGVELYPEGKVSMYEFPLGHDSLDQPLDPDCLVKAHQHDTSKKRYMAIQSALDKARRE